jgi:GNAT superfamily N-acetyltransferase
MPFLLRPATSADIPRLREIIQASVRTLQAADYTPAQLEGALESVYGVDTQLIADGTYFAVVRVAARVDDEPAELEGFVAAVFRPPSQPPATPPGPPPTIVACGGWSKRKTLYGGDQFAQREDSLLDPALDAAKIRAFFVRPQFARRGLGTLILAACEDAARAAGFTRLEMGSTLTGVAFYRAQGYAPLENLQVPLSNGEMLPIVKMSKEFKREF